MTTTSVGAHRDAPAPMPPATNHPVGAQSIAPANDGIVDHNGVTL